MIVIIKPTESCNARCVYCSASPEDGVYRGRMTDEVLLRVFNEFRTFLEDHPREHVIFTWHGGEPLLMGSAFFHQVNELQRSIFGEYLPRVRNRIQSNLILLTRELVEEICQLPNNGKGIGTSFDLVPDIRLLASGESYEAAWFKAAELAQSRDLNLGLGYVVHKLSLGRERELYYFCKNLNTGRTGVRMNPLHVVGRGASRHALDLRISPEEYGQFINNISDIWEEDGRALDVQPVKEWSAGIEGDYGGMCCESSGKCHETHLGVSAGGDVFNCGRASDAKVLHYGNLLQDSLREVLARRDATVLPGRADRLRDSDSECGSCDLWRWCHGGCPVDGHVYHEDLSTSSPWCASRKLFHQHYLSRQAVRQGGQPGTMESQASSIREPSR